MAIHEEGSKLALIRNGETLMCEKTILNFREKMSVFKMYKTFSINEFWQTNYEEPCFDNIVNLQEGQQISLISRKQQINCETIVEQI